MPQNAVTSAQIYDFAAHRMQRIARLRRISGAKRQFLLSWPGTGRLVTVNFPNPAPTGWRALAVDG
jgi:hypothetical protein